MQRNESTSDRTSYISPRCEHIGQGFQEGGGGTLPSHDFSRNETRWSAASHSSIIQLFFEEISTERSSCFPESSRRLTAPYNQSHNPYDSNSVRQPRGRKENRLPGPHEAGGHAHP